MVSRKISRDPVEEARFKINGATQRASSSTQRTKSTALSKSISNVAGEEDPCKKGSVLIITTDSKSSTTEMPSAMRP